MFWHINISANHEIEAETVGSKSYHFKANKQQIRRLRIWNSHFWQHTNVHKAQISEKWKTSYFTILASRVFIKPTIPANLEEIQFQSADCIEMTYTSQLIQSLLVWENSKALINYKLHVIFWLISRNDLC